MSKFEKVCYVLGAFFIVISLYLCAGASMIYDTTTRIETAINRDWPRFDALCTRVKRMDGNLTEIEKKLPKESLPKDTEENLVLHIFNRSADEINKSWWEVICYCGSKVTFECGVNYEQKLIAMGWTHNFITERWECPDCSHSYISCTTITRPMKTRRVRCGNCLCTATLEITIPDTRKETKLKAIEAAGWQPVIWNYEKGNCWSGSDGDVLYSTCPNCREDDY